MPSVGSGRYSPGPGTVKLLEEGVYQEIRPPVANCSLIRPDFFTIDSFFLDFAQPDVPRKHALFDLMEEIPMIEIPIRKLDDRTASVRTLCGSLDSKLCYVRNILRAISS